MRKEIYFCFILIFVAYSPLLTTGTTEASNLNSESTEFSWAGSANSVELVGEWDWNNPIPMLENNGVWTTNITLIEGIYCYKFIVDGNYIFDPENSYRGYCGEYENSIIRVKNHTRPNLIPSLSGEILTVSFIPGSDGAGPDGTPNSIQGATWNPNTWEWTYDISGLSDGKHTLHLTIDDLDGNSAYDQLAPFWKGEQSNFSWEDALIYMIMTDRFVNGNTSNDPLQTGASQGADWMGGDFAGVTEKIESGYFSNLGVNVLWLTPFNTGANDTGKASDSQHDVSAYHGYWPVEPRQIDPRLGTENELKNLVEVAHNSGIRVMMDYVINHVHENHSYFSDNPNWFNEGCICGTSNCGWTENRIECQFANYLPDVNWKNREASEQMISDLLWWLEEFDLDGVRLDAVKHVDDLAISNIVKNVNERFETVGTDYYLKGETAMGWDGHSLEDNQDQYGTINQYMGQGGLDGQADFVLYHAVVDNVFTSGNMDYSHLDYWTHRSQDQYTPGSTMVPFVGSHDVPRFASRADSGTADEWNQWVEDGLPGQPGSADSYNASLQAYGWLFTTPGAAMLYYGDEYGEYGGADPDNRHMWRDNNTWNENENRLAENISHLGTLRQQSEALRRGTYSTIMSSVDVLIYSMATTQENMNIVLNRGISNYSLSDFSLNHSILFGDYDFDGNNLSLPGNSITIIEINGNLGCTNNTATNFDSSAIIDDGTCVYFVEEEVLGCNDPTAINYDSIVTIDDGTCEYETEPITGCTSPSAQNYDVLAEVDDGSCTYSNNDTNNSSDNNTNNDTNETVASNQTGLSNESIIENNNETQLEIEDEFVSEECKCSDGSTGTLMNSSSDSCYCSSEQTDVESSSSGTPLFSATIAIFSLLFIIISMIFFIRKND